MFSLITTLIAILPRLLYLAVCAAAAIYAVARWGRHPRVSLLVLISMLLFIISLVAGVGLNWMLPAIQRSNIPPGQFVSLFSSLTSLISTLAVALLALAAFIGRKPQS
jgi:hypothetical protein